MPRRSEKSKLRRDLWWRFITIAAAEGLASPAAMRWLALYYGIRQQRYLTTRSISVPKCNWATAILPELDERRFRKFVRMDRITFEEVLCIVENDPVFHLTENNNAQVPVRHQLAIALHRLGHHGTGGDVQSTAALWGVSEGHIINCTKRVILALCKRRDEYVQWPDAQERRLESMKNDARAGFLGCVGKADGTDIVLDRKPGGQYDGEHFFNRKKRYAMDLLAVCDSRRMFTYMLSGWPNSQHDARVFASSALNRRSTEFFDDNQYVLADSAYACCDHLIPPYKNPAALKLVNKRFNRKLSSIRIDIEHAFGMLKGRWNSLTGLRLCLYNEQQYEYMVQWITACVVLHNILLTLSDIWDIEDGWWTEEEEEEHEEDLLIIQAEQTRTGMDRREVLKGIVLGVKSSTSS